MTQRDSHIDNDDDLPPTGPQRMICNAGRPVFEQGAPAHQAFYVEEGLLEVTIEEDDHKIPLAQIGPGEIFGEMGVLENEMRMATVTALEKSIITVISRKELEEKLENTEDKFVKSLIEVLLKRLRQSSQGQVQHYKNLVSFQNRISNLMIKADQGVNPEKRDSFTEQVMPLLDRLEELLDDHRK